MLWVMILTVVLKNGDVHTDMRWPLNNQMNNESECRKQADNEAGKLQLKIGSDNGVVLFNCLPIPFKDIKSVVNSEPSA